MAGTRWSTKTLLYGGLAGGLLLAGGALGSRAEIWPFDVGFLAATAGVAVAAIVVAWGIGALVVVLRRELQREVPALLAGLAVSLVAVGAFAVQLNQVFSVPPIHQVTTDIDDPPAFDAVVGLRPAGSNPHGYDGDQPILETTLAEAQRAAWPELTSLRTRLDPHAALQRAVAVVERMGMAVVNVDADAGIVEATDTTVWFGFEDDFVVRIRGNGEGAVVDARSVSRVGVSDLGVNARRVLRFLERFAIDA